MSGRIVWAKLQDGGTDANVDLRGYANYTNNAWFLRIHGQAYKQALPINGEPSPVSQSALDKAANVFLPDVDISRLPANEQANARNLTSAVLSIPQGNIPFEFTVRVSSLQPQSNFRGTGNWENRFTWPKRTDSRGELDGWVSLYSTAQGQLPSDQSSNGILRLDVTTNGTNTGNATAYLVPSEGYTILSDIDDILRVTKIYVPKEGLLNTFARDFEPWENMPEIYSAWDKQHPENPYHFHYLTTTPEQATRRYEDFIYATYPQGSFDTRPLNFTTWDQTFNVRRTLLNKILETYPRRKFVLVGDTTNSDVLTNYPEVAKVFPNVACILLRNTSATDPDNKFPYNTAGFKDLPENKYMFFKTPDDLRGLDFQRGDCRNPNVQTRISGGWMNLPFGKETSGGDSARGKEKVWWVVWMALGAMGVAAGL